VHVPAIEVQALTATIPALGTFVWGVVTSVNGADAAVRAAATDGGGPARGWAAVGDGTAAVLERAGLPVGFKPSTPRAEALAAELPVRPADLVLVLRGDLAGDGLATELRARGASVDDVIAYRTVEAPAASGPRLREALAAGIDAIVLTSGSTARGLIALAGTDAVDALGIPAICAGEPTASEARRLGFRTILVASSPGPDAIASAVTAALDAPAPDRPAHQPPTTALEVPAHGSN
jgi:uroporphyrinogen-III synthase